MRMLLGVCRSSHPPNRPDSSQVAMRGSHQLVCVGEHHSMFVLLSRNKETSRSDKLPLSPHREPVDASAHVGWNVAPTLSEAAFL